MRFPRWPPRSFRESASSRNWPPVITGTQNWRNSFFGAPDQSPWGDPQVP